MSTFTPMTISIIVKLRLNFSSTRTSNRLIKNNIAVYRIYGLGYEIEEDASKLEVITREQINI